MKQGHTSKTCFESVSFPNIDLQYIGYTGTGTGYIIRAWVSRVSSNIYWALSLCLIARSSWQLSIITSPDRFPWKYDYITCCSQPSLPSSSYGEILANCGLLSGISLGHRWIKGRNNTADSFILSLSSRKHRVNNTFMLWSLFCTSLLCFITSLSVP